MWTRQGRRVGSWSGGRLWGSAPAPTERIALDSGRGWQQLGAAAIPVEYEVLLDGHDGDLISLITGLLQDPVDHDLLVGAVAEPHTPQVWRLKPSPQEVTATITSVLSSRVGPPESPKQVPPRSAGSGTETGTRRP
jgi:hypothetical protein